MRNQEEKYYELFDENSTGWRKEPENADTQYYKDAVFIVERAIEKTREVRESVNFILSEIGNAFASAFESFPATEEIVLEGVYEKERKAIDEIYMEYVRDMIANNIATAMRTKTFGQYVNDPAFKGTPINSFPSSPSSEVISCP